LRDLVSYNEKHNERNGEENGDGSWGNSSWNSGAEGPTDDPEIEALRLRRQKSLFAVLFLSQGVPFMLAGDEFGRTKAGNNNTYCQDNALGWTDWAALSKNRELNLPIASPSCRIPPNFRGTKNSSSARLKTATNSLPCFLMNCAIR